MLNSPTCSEQLTVTEVLDPTNDGARVLSSFAIILFRTTKPVADDIFGGNSHLTVGIVDEKKKKKEKNYNIWFLPVKIILTYHNVIQSHWLHCDHRELLQHSCCDDYCMALLTEPSFH